MAMCSVVDCMGSFSDDLLVLSGVDLQAFVRQDAQCFELFIDLAICAFA